MTYPSPSPRDNSANVYALDSQDSGENSDIFADSEAFDLFKELHDDPQQQKLLIAAAVKRIINRMKADDGVGQARTFLEFDFGESFEKDLKGLRQEWKPVAISVMLNLRRKISELLKSLIVEDPLLADKARIGAGKRVLGEGGMGSVSVFGTTEMLPEHLFGFYVPSKVPIAVKQFDEEIDLSHLNPHIIKKLTEIDNPHVLKYFGITELKNGERVEIREYVPGARSLADILLSKESDIDLQAHQMLEIILGGAQGLKAFLQAGLLHNDFKPGNIIVPVAKESGLDAGNSRLIDFDLASELNGNFDSGTPGYRSPERENKQRQHANSDVYSIGAILCQLFFQAMPYNFQQGNIVPAEDFFFHLPEKVPGRIKKMMSMLLEHNPEQRADIDEALEILETLRQMSLSGKFADFLCNAFEKSKKLLKNQQLKSYQNQPADSIVEQVSQASEHYAPGMIIDMIEFIPEKERGVEVWSELAKAYEQLGKADKARWAREKKRL